MSTALDIVHMMRFVASLKPKVVVSQFKTRFDVYKPYEGTYIYLKGQKLRCISEDWIEIVW